MMQLTTNQRLIAIAISIAAIIAVNVFAPGAAATVMSVALTLINHAIESKDQTQ